MSLRAAVNATCKKCIYDELGGQGTWLNQVANCTSFSCPLYSVRPTPRISTAKQRSLILAGEKRQIDVAPDHCGSASWML